MMIVLLVALILMAICGFSMILDIARDFDDWMDVVVLGILVVLECATLALIYLAILRL